MFLHDRTRKKMHGSCNTHACKNILLRGHSREPSTKMHLICDLETWIRQVPIACAAAWCKALTEWLANWTGEIVERECWKKMIHDFNFLNLIVQEQGPKTPMVKTLSELGTCTPSDQGSSTKSDAGSFESAARQVLLHDYSAGSRWLVCLVWIEFLSNWHVKYSAAAAFVNAEYFTSA